jgi:probable rRNA maturation factor
VVRLCSAAFARAGASAGHLAVEFVDARRIATLNGRHRGKREPTDVLSFPIDELQGEDGVEHEFGDIVICPQHTIDLREAIVHGALHLLGMDHERDDGEMLTLQAEILASVPGGSR